MSVAPASFDAAIAAVAARQHSLVTFAQARAAGGTPPMIKRRVASGRWIRLDHGLYRLTGSAFTWHTRVLAACLSSGGVASHRTAAALWNLDESPKGPPEITIARGRSFRRPDIRVHESTDLALANVRRVEGIQTTGVDRLLVDLGAVLPESSLEELLFDAVNRKLVSWPDVWESLALHARRGRNGIGPLRRVMASNYGLAVPESKLEIILERMIEDAGLPRPDRQVTILDDDGVIGRVDFAYPSLGIAIEVDGRSVHARRDTLVRDQAKRNRIGLAGWTLLVFTSESLLLTPQAVHRQLAQALARAGVAAA